MSMSNSTDLTRILNVGIANAGDFQRIGVHSIDDLKNADAMLLFKRLCAVDGARHDPCTLDVFMSAVDYATNGTSKPWWEYTELRKTLYE